ncbi:MAG TPA: hypothetical protein PKE26_07385 [Kiritimatiellia bacterium]|nr:hypothetical protein [Kiritimatiellia bacterium]HMO98914.1 hypothetical protein [Kiritimatiellia bacterium]
MSKFVGIHVRAEGDYDTQTIALVSKLNCGLEMMADRLIEEAE